MNITSFLILQFIIAIGAYIQTTTGFAFGLVVVIGVTVLNIMPLEQSAMFVMLLGLINIAFAIDIKYITFRRLKTLYFLWIIIPSTALGSYLLYALIDYPTGYNILYFSLGVFTIVASLILMFLSGEKFGRSPPHTFYFYSILSGLCGGLFSASGPTMMYLLHRQPWALKSIRNTLLLSFATVIVSRGAVLILQDNFMLDIVIYSLLSLPTVIITTWLAKKYINFINKNVVKKISFSTLFISGVYIVVKIWI